MNSKIINILQKIDLPTLQNLVGATILKAIRSVNAGEDEQALSEILTLKYDTSILNQKEIRTAIINALSLDDAIRLSYSSGLKSDSNFKLYGLLVKYFEASYSFKKSKILVDFLDLDESHYFQKQLDLREERETIIATYDEEVKILSYLHPYQKRVKDEIMMRLNKNSEKKFFVQMPTGSGKTYTALECVVDVLRKPRTIGENNKPESDKFIVWLVDRNELVEQALASFKRIWKIRGDRDINVYRLFKDFEPDFTTQNAGVVFAGFDKLYSILKNSNHKAYDSVHHLVKNSELLILDEAHHSMAETYFNCIDIFLKTPFIKVMGLSATPGTSDSETTQKLVELFSSDKISIRDGDWNHVSNPITYLQNGNYLACLSTKLLETGVTIKESDEGRVLYDLASNSDRNEKIVKQILLANTNNESTVVFACTLDHVYALLIMCRANNIVAKYIIGEVEQSSRLGILNEFKNREYFVLINLDILSTGIDLPNIDKVIIARPINSANLISQILGRALRGPKNGGNKHNTIINIKDNIINFPGASFLYNYYQGEWENIT